MILRDGNGAIYPLAKDCVEGIRDPLWLDLPPMQCLGMSVQALHQVAPNCKNRVAILALAVQVLHAFGIFNNSLNSDLVCYLAVWY